MKDHFTFLSLLVVMAILLSALVDYWLGMGMLCSLLAQVYYGSRFEV